MVVRRALAKGLYAARADAPLYAEALGGVRRDSK